MWGFLSSVRECFSGQCKGQVQAPEKEWVKDYRLVEDGLEERGELVGQVDKNTSALGPIAGHLFWPLLETSWEHR